MRIVWDTVGERFYETGVDHGVLYPYNSETGAFDNGVAWNGLTAVNEQPSGAEPSPLYADNIKYLNLMSAEEYASTIEAYTYPDEFEECDGSAELAPGVVVGQQPRKMFGVSYRTLIGNDTEGTSKGYKLHLVYNCLASPSERSHATVNDSPEAATLSWSVSTTPVEVPGFKPTATITIDSTKVSAAKMAVLEEVLYGNASTAPKLPLPAEIIEIFGNAAETGIVITPVTASIGVGESFLLNAETVPGNAQITYTSSDTDKATVTGSGVVKGIAAGSATVTATITVDGTDYTDTCTVTVSE